VNPLAVVKSWVGGLVPQSWLPSNWTLGTLVREPSTGAWQRNLACNDPSLLTFSAVYACITVISGDVAKLGLYLYSRDAEGVRELAARHPISNVLRRPNDYQTQLELIQQMMISTLGSGNAYLLKRRDQRGVVNALYLLDPHQVRPVVTPEGSVFYSLGGDMRLAGVASGEQIVVPASEIIHHRINAFAHPLLGTTPLVAASMSASVGLNIMQNSQAFFANMSRPGGVLSAPGKISEPMATRLRTEWEKNYGGSNIGKIAVLAEGLKFDGTATVNAVDSQLIDQLRWSVEDVARVFRVPGFMLGDLSKVTYRNSEQLQRTYYSGCLQFHLEALEARLHQGFELDDSHFVEFDLDNLLRTEIDVRFDAYQKAINAGFYSINDARRREDMPPVDGGDEPLVQAQYRPLSAAIAEADAAVEKAKRDAAAPVAPPPPPDDDELDDDDQVDDARALTARLTEGFDRYVRTAA
jgi:HK97 family phage portal protein